MMAEDLSNFSMLDLFRLEAESQVAILVEGLLGLEQDPGAADRLEALMRASHSIKGAARIVNLNAAVQVAHALEDVFVAAQQGHICLSRTPIDTLLAGVDMLSHIALGEIQGGPAALEAILIKLAAILVPPQVAEPNTAITAFIATTAALVELPPASEPAPSPSDRLEPRTRSLRVSAESLDRLMGLAGEALVESRSLKPFTDSLLQLKRREMQLVRVLENLCEVLEGVDLPQQARLLLADAQHRSKECAQTLSERFEGLEAHGLRSTNLSHRLSEEVITSRMRPFADGVQGFARMVRDLSHSLGKEVQLIISGENTQVDREILRQLEAPLGHLLRNAVDHGIEPPLERSSLKPPQGTVRLEAQHMAGMLSVTVTDDGRGVDLVALQRRILERGLASAEMIGHMSESELLDFLFLPNFTTRNTVSEISGRGVGLDVVRSMIKDTGGTVHASTTAGQGTRFHLRLPVTRSVIRAVLVQIARQRYAFPLARIERVIKLDRANIEMLENRQFFRWAGRCIGLVSAHQVLELEEQARTEELSVVVIRDQSSYHGLVVDRLMGEQELVVRTLDRRLGKVRDVSAAAVLEDGSLVWILDIEDLARSIDALVSGGRIDKVRSMVANLPVLATKRILVVDDSITVREVERKLLRSRGYDVEVAVDGMDGWNAVRSGTYDLVVSDIDMPRLDGIELVRLIKQDPKLKDLPVIIVSYKDRPEDRNRGLEAGADYYLTKGSFHDQTLLNAVSDLIGEVEA
ncbi:MAG: hybrid sensor histidine kinase/response regulator [Gemmatimonadaceae bacterium]|nr:hybrid sensor histidine kinase/response regulator [Gloeobacterales cyanobacterium ES-bin-141]